MFFLLAARKNLKGWSPKGVMLYVWFVSLFTLGLHVLFVSLCSDLTTVQSQNAWMAIYNLTKSEPSYWI